MADWHTDETGSVIGFPARPVVRGHFLKMLYAKPLCIRDVVALRALRKAARSAAVQRER